MYESWIVVGSEIALALYPILIKTVPTTLVTQLLSRFLVFTVAAAVLGGTGAIQGTWGTPKAALRSLGLGGITFAHVIFSYKAFTDLPAGAAMGLFYTYPIWNILAGMLLFGEKIDMQHVGLVALAFLGVVLISLDTKAEGAEGQAEGFGSESGSRSGSRSGLNWTGISAALLAAITETAMYMGVRTTHIPDPYFSTLELYPGALMILLAFMGLGGLKTPGALDTRPSVWKPMLLFNILIGFLGYALRFYAIPKVATVVFSILSFVGVVASFLWGWLFVEEKPSALSIAGASLISLASALV